MLLLITNTHLLFFKQTMSVRPGAYQYSSAGQIVVLSLLGAVITREPPYLVPPPWVLVLHVCREIT